MSVTAERAEEARARMLVLFPEGFEEVHVGDGLELVAYVDAEGERRLRAAFDHVSSEPVADDWAERWRAFHRPVRIGPLWIGPPWERPPDGATALVIDPGRAFGTGAHPTTRLTLELLVQADRGSLLDVGCGSGVLSIAAAKLGFHPVHAIDVDESAVEATAENADRNRVRLVTAAADAMHADLPAADVVLANIALEAVEAIAPRLRARTLVTSGYLDEQHPQIGGRRHLKRATADGWAADMYGAV